jgi:hypothetical protein
MTTSYQVSLPEQSPQTDRQPTRRPLPRASLQPILFVADVVVVVVCYNELFVNCYDSAEHYDRSDAASRYFGLG